MFLPVGELGFHIFDLNIYPITILDLSLDGAEMDALEMITLETFETIMICTILLSQRMYKIVYISFTYH